MSKAREAVPIRIVVDERERRSRIPALLRDAGAVTDFAQLKVGDYIISAETAIERKTIFDLLQSIFNGRLLLQCSELIKHYAKPVIIIEGNIINLSDRSVGNDIQDSERIFLINETMARVALDFRIPIVNAPAAEFTSQLLVAMANIALNGVSKGPFLKHIKKANPVRIQQLSILSSIPGIGDKLAMRMLEKFSTPRHALTAPAADLARIPGFGTSRAIKMRRILDSADEGKIVASQLSLLDAKLAL